MITEVTLKMSSQYRYNICLNLLFFSPFRFFWMSTGKPMTYENWNAGEPNNFQYENGEQEHCLELWNRDGKGLRWNDTPCSFETFFVCEV